MASVLLAAAALAIALPVYSQGSDDQVPEKPTNLTGSVAANSVTLYWDNAGDSSITGFQLLRRNPEVDDRGVFQTVVDDTGNTKIFYTDNTVEQGTRYFYRVRARNSVGLSPMSAFFSAQVPARDPDGTPSEATNLGDITDQDGVTFHRDSVNDTSDTLDYYKFTLTADRQVGLGLRRQDGNGNLRLEDDSGNVLSNSTNSGTADEWISQNVSAGTYYIRVKAQGAGTIDYGLRYGVSPAVEPPVNSAASGLPTITGTAQVPETLTADTSGITDSNGLTGVQYAHQWVRSSGGTDTDIPGATGSTHTLTSGDLAATIKVRVRFTDDDGFSESLTSAATAAVTQPANVAPSGLPTISGTVEVGEILTADASSITDANGLTGAEFAYQWIQSMSGTDTNIAGAAGSSYTITSANSGYALKIQVTFTDGDGHSESLTSAATGALSVAGEADTTPEPEGQDFSDDTSTTGVIVVGDSVTGDVSFNKDVDWYKVQLTKDMAYSFDLMGKDSVDTGTLWNPYLHGLHDSGGNQIPGTADDGHGNFADSYFHFKIDRTGTYYIAAGAIHYGYHSTVARLSQGTYTLAVADITDSLVDDCRQGITGNCTLAVATANADGTVTGTSAIKHKIERSGDEDWLKVTLTQGHEYVFEVKGLYSGNGTLRDPVIEGVYDPEGDFIQGTQDDDTGVYSDARVFHTATETGDHFVRAENDHSATGEYTISAIDISDGLPDDFTAGITTTGTVAVGGQVTGNIEYRGDRDWFKVALDAGKKYRFDLERTDRYKGLEDPYIHGIHDSAGTLIEGTTDNNSGGYPDAKVIYKPTTAGDYYVAVGGTVDIRIGSYKLRVRKRN